MKKISDEELQKLLENGSQPENPSDKDFVLYSTVFKELADCGDPGLDIDLPESVIKKIRIEDAKNDNQLYSLWLLLICFGGFSLSIGVLLVFSPEIILSNISMLKMYGPQIASAVVALMIIQLLDRKVIRRVAAEI